MDTISAPHDLGPYPRLTAMDGTPSHLGHPGPATVEMTDLLVERKKLSSAGSGGRPAITAMLDFCAEHSITADIELLPPARVYEALDRRRHHDVRHRFVARHVRPGRNDEESGAGTYHRPDRKPAMGKA